MSLKRLAQPLIKRQLRRRMTRLPHASRRQDGNRQMTSGSLQRLVPCTANDSPVNCTDLIGMMMLKLVKDFCRHVLGIISLSMLLLGLGDTTSLALNIDEQQVAEGSGAIIKRNQATARTKAITNALRKALEQTLLATLDPIELVDNAQTLETTLYARTLAYIRSYRVLWEYPDFTQGVYRVGLEVSLATDEVDKAIQALGLSQAGTRQGRLLVLITEHRLQRSHLSSHADSDGVVAQTLHHYFASHNFQTVRPVADATWDGQASTALMAAKRAGAEVVLIGQANAKNVRSDVAGMPLQAVHASVQVQALAVATGRRLAMEHIEATALHADAVLGGTQALRKAAAEVASRLEPPLRQHLLVYGKVNAP